MDGPLAAPLTKLEGEALTAGLRPEGWRVSPATNRNLSASVVHSEVLGNEQLITCRLTETNHLVQVRAAPEQTHQSGDVVHLDPDPAGWRLFDQHGEALAWREPTDPGPQLPDLS